MRLTDDERAMLDGAHGEARRIALDGLVKLGRAFDAPDMVRIGYAHVHAGMALYLHDVELVEEFAALGAAVAVPTSVNMANADTEHWRQTGAPESLARLQQRVKSAHAQMGASCTLTCTPYWAGHWPTWNTHMTSIESTVTIFCNSVLGARSNRDGYFAIYAAVTGRYPRFGYHLDEQRRGTHRVHVAARLDGTTDFSALGFHVGTIVGDGVPVFDALAQRPSLDELDALGAALATSGGASMFIVPGMTPPYASVEDAFRGRARHESIAVDDAGIASVYERFGRAASDRPNIVHLGCPHASMEEMRGYARLLAGKRIAAGLELWITTSRNVRNAAQAEGLVGKLEAAGAKIVSDTCPMACHFARTVSPDPALGVVPPAIDVVVVDSAKQAKYVRDMIQCDTLLTGTAEAIETALSGRFVARRPPGRGALRAS
jgi:hypothetical protein